MSEPYYETPDGAVVLYLGDCREVLPELAVTADLAIADPPYASTQLPWDKWPSGWPAVVAKTASSLWCFGTLRMFLDVAHEFADWKLSQDVIWEKHNGSRPVADRLLPVHETMTHWYRGRWKDLYHRPPRFHAGRDPRSRLNGGVRKPATDRHHGVLTGPLAWTDDGTRIVRSVIRVRSMHNLRGVNRTQKPVDLLRPLIEYACPPGGLVLDPFTGSGSALVVARNLGCRAIGVEADEREAEKAAKRLTDGAA